MSTLYQKTGYLNSDFRIFYLTSAEPRDFQSHYHDFHKLLLFVSGSVSYYIEGETYQLQPYDIVLVPAGEVHRPVIHDKTPYRRLIIYLSPALFEQYQTLGANLGRCFSLCSARRSHVLRISRFQESRLYPQYRELADAALEEASASRKPGSAENSSEIQDANTQFAFSVSAESQLYRQSVLLQFLILLNRTLDGDDISFPVASGANPQVLAILAFINEHLTDELNVDQIAEACFLNRSYLMHLFRRETGCTIGAYITEKRLFAARTLIQSGTSVTDACMRSGFASYAAFYHAYRKKFGESPKESRTGRLGI